MPTYIYTTYDAAVNPVNCCAHMEVYNSSNVQTLHLKRFANANTFVNHEGLWYFISYDPAKADNKRCCVWTTSTEPDANGNLRIIKDRVLCCGDRVAL